MICKSTALALCALAVLAVAGCGGNRTRVSGRETQKQTAASSSYASAGDFASFTAIPTGTPQWLVDEAQLTAKSLHNPHPRKLRIVLGDPYVIEMWGHFLCDKTCSYPAGAKPPHG